MLFNVFVWCLVIINLSTNALKCFPFASLYTLHWLFFGYEKYIYLITTATLDHDFLKQVIASSIHIQLALQGLGPQLPLSKHTEINIKQTIMIKYLV